MATAERVLDIFEAFARLQKPLTLSQLSNAVGAPVSSCFSIVKTLEESGYLHCVSDRKEWYPTGRMAAHARAIEKGEPLLARFDPILTALRKETDETIILGQASSTWNSILYLKVFESSQAIRYTSEIGAKKPIHSTAIGKAILSSMPEEQRSRIAKSLKFKDITGRTLVDAADLLEDIRKGLDRGYQMTRGENVVDVGALAMPVKFLGRTFGVAVAGPVERLKNHLDAHEKALRGACEELEALTG